MAAAKAVRKEEQRVPEKDAVEPLNRLLSLIAATHGTVRRIEYDKDTGTPSSIRADETGQDVDLRIRILPPG